jgi:hypothetical protein
MRYFTHSISIVVSLLVVSAPALVSAQGATAPARETPRPQDVDPGVNTSATPAREAPRPQDIEPGVNTSATPPSDPAPPSSSGAAARSAPASAAAPARATPSAPPRGSASNAGLVGNKPAPDAKGAGTAGAKPAASTASGAKGKASDRLELDTTQITGNRELPKVLYIVPWKRADLGDLVGKPVNSSLDEVLTPVDRDVFKRENRYYRALAPAEGQPGANGAPPSGTAPNSATSSGSAAPAARDEK